MDFTTCFNTDKPILLEGALGERLKREYALSPHPDVAWASLVYSERGRAALGALWNQYIGIAKQYGLPFAATTPTRRANRKRAALTGYNGALIRDNVDFLREIQSSAGHPVTIGGLMGCRGDAYRATDVLSTPEAHGFHAWQAECFAQANVDFLYAGIMPALTEAAGMALAMADTGIPYIISFMIRENGRLIDGTPIHDAVGHIDAITGNKPLCYMCNCVHPDVLYRALAMEFNRTALVRERFRGIQPNTSPLPPEALDGAEDLKCGDAGALAASIGKLYGLIDLRIVGGCCGTDDTHIREIAALLAAKA